MRAVLFVLSALFSVTCMAQARQIDSDSQDETNVRRIARERQYLGGEDEESLKVQEQLPDIKKEGSNEAADGAHSGDED